MAVASASKTNFTPAAFAASSSALTLLNVPGLRAARTVTRFTPRAAAVRAASVTMKLAFTPPAMITTSSPSFGLWPALTFSSRSSAAQTFFPSAPGMVSCSGFVAPTARKNAL